MHYNIIVSHIPMFWSGAFSWVSLIKDFLRIFDKRCATCFGHIIK